MKSLDSYSHFKELSLDEMRSLNGGIVCGGLCVALVAGLVTGIVLGSIATYSL